MRLSPDRQQRIAACLHTLGSSLADTIQQNPRNTIAPRPTGEITAVDALGVLNRLTDSSSSTNIAVHDTLGQGGMGLIRLATQTSLDRTVVVKSLRPDRRNDDAILDLLREAWITGSLEHPNVVPVHEIGLDEDGSPLIVLKRIEGVSWSELMRDPETVRARFDADDLLEWNLGIFLQVINAVRFAHSRGIIHRDLKPENVMIGEFGEVYVLDWGLAVSLDDDSGRLPAARDVRTMAGTPAYMAPEMLGPDDESPLSERTDIYLLGAILFEIITGHPPHTGDSVIEVVTSVVTSEPELPPGTPPDLVRICRRAMAFEQEDRYERAEELRQAVQKFSQHRGAMRLAEGAERRLSELLELLAQPDTGDTDRRQQLYKCFGACRFGFQEALAAWNDYHIAQAGLRQAIIAMAEYELDSGDPRAAAALLAELSEVPESLRDQVDNALRTQKSEKERLTQLAKLGADVDMAAGARARTIIAGVMASVWTTMPLAGALVGHESSWMNHPGLLSWTLAFFVLLLALLAWAREPLMKSGANRRLMGSLVFVFIAQMGLQAGTYTAGMSARTTVMLDIFLWFSTAGLLTVTMDPYIAPIAVGYFTAFVIAAWQPSLMLYAIAGANLVVLITSLTIWRRFLQGRHPSS